MATRKCEAEQSTETSAKPNNSVDSSLSKNPDETTPKHTRPPKIQKTISFKACNSEKESPSAIKDSEITCDSALHATVDSLINEFKEFKIRSCESRKESQQNPLFAVNGKVYEKTAQLLLNWPDVKNIPRPGVRMQTY